MFRSRQREGVQFDASGPSALTEHRSGALMEVASQVRSGAIAPYYVTDSKSNRTAQTLGVGAPTYRGKQLTEHTGQHARIRCQHNCSQQHAMLGAMSMLNLSYPEYYSD